MKIQGNELQIQGLVACIDRDNIDTDQISIIGHSNGAA